MSPVPQANGNRDRYTGVAIALHWVMALGIFALAALGLVRLGVARSCCRAHQVTRRRTDFSGGYAAYAIDPSNAERLWDLSLKLIA
jgi:hypothetical protein